MRNSSGAEAELAERAERLIAQARAGVILDGPDAVASVAAGYIAMLEDAGSAEVRNAALEEALEMIKATAHLYQKWAKDAAEQVPEPNYVMAAQYASKSAGALGAYMEVRSLLNPSSPSSLQPGAVGGR